MANRTESSAKTVHGKNPQFIIPQIIRAKIYDSQYWKEHCFGLSAETLVDKACGLTYIAGTFGGNRKPSKFICLLQKLLQISPDIDIIEAYIEQTDFKYLQALGAFYLRLVCLPSKIYQTIENWLILDNRKLVFRLSSNSQFKIIHMDEFGDALLHLSSLLDIDLPKLPKRELVIGLPPKVSLMDEEFQRLKDNDKLDTIQDVERFENTWV